MQQGGDADGDIYGNVYVYTCAYCTYHIGSWNKEITAPYFSKS